MTIALPPARAHDGVEAGCVGRIGPLIDMKDLMRLGKVARSTRDAVPGSVSTSTACGRIAAVGRRIDARFAAERTCQPGSCAQCGMSGLNRPRAARCTTNKRNSRRG
jgi:hypothetical protein